MRRSVSKAATKIALRKEVRKRGRSPAPFFKGKRCGVWTKKNAKERMGVKLKKKVSRKRITEEVCSGFILKTTNPNPAEEIRAKIKIGNKNLGICVKIIT